MPGSVQNAVHLCAYMSGVAMETVTYTRNTRTPAGGYQIMIKRAGIML